MQKEKLEETKMQKEENQSENEDKNLAQCGNEEAGGENKNLRPKCRQLILKPKVLF